MTFSVGFQLYENGEEYPDITGGISTGTQIYSIAEKRSDFILLSAAENTNSAYSHSTCFTNNSIDLTGHSKLKAVVHTEKYGSLSGFVKLGITDSQINFAEPTEYREDYISGVMNESTGDVTLTYDISGVSGSYYVGIINRANATKVYSIILE